jgi:hypothetical protein
MATDATTGGTDIGPARHLADRSDLLDDFRKVWARQKVIPESNNVRFGSKADMCAAISHVRFTPESGHQRRKRNVR